MRMFVHYMYKANAYVQMYFCTFGCCTLYGIRRSKENNNVPTTRSSVGGASASNLPSAQCNVESPYRITLDHVQDFLLR